MFSIRKRNIVVCILLCIITLGLYSVYWYYILVKNTRAIKNDESSCAGEMLCLVFVPFYSIYWWYTRGKLVKNEFDNRGFFSSGNEIAYLILEICRLGVVAMAIMQSDFNSLPVEPKSIQ